MEEHLVGKLGISQGQYIVTYAQYTKHMNGNTVYLPLPYK